MSDRSRIRRLSDRAGSTLAAGLRPLRTGVKTARGRSLSVLDAAAARVGLAPRPAAPQPGWRTVARKEFGDHIASLRFLILLVIIGLACLVAVINAAGFLRDVASGTADAPISSPFLLLFTQSDNEIFPFVRFLGLFAPLVGIAFGFDAINQERADGTLPRLVSQPIHRDDVINGKFAAGLATIGVTLAIVVVIMSGVGILRLGVTPSASDAARLVAFVVITLAYVGVWMAFAILCSVLLRRAATAALVVFSTWLVLTLFGTWLAGLVAGAVGPADELGRRNLEYTLSQFTPAGLYDASAASVLADPSFQVAMLGRGDLEQAANVVDLNFSLLQSLLAVWPQVTALVAVCVVLFTVAYMAFLRQEIRA
ncbi:MAG TPA: ABC transporter permease [Jiangellaceae bacterium]